MNLKCQSLSCGILFLFSVITKEQFTTVPLKSKLTLEPQDSIFEPRCSKRSRIEKQGFLEYAKTRKGFEETIYFSKEK